MAPSTPPVPTASTAVTTGATTTLEIATIPTGAGTPVWLTVPAVATGDISFTPAGSKTSYPTYGTGNAAYDRAIKTGLSGTLSVKTSAPGGEPSNALLLAAGNSVGAAAQLLFRIHNPDDSWWSGTITVDQSVTMNPNRGVFEYSHSSTTDGPFKYTAPGV